MVRDGVKQRRRRTDQQNTLGCHEQAAQLRLAGALRQPASGLRVQLGQRRAGQPHGSRLFVRRNRAIEQDIPQQPSGLPVEGEYMMPVGAGSGTSQP